MNTLKGIFPEPKQVPKRNFVRENMVYIKQMQGLMQCVNTNYGTKEKAQMSRFNSGRKTSRSNADTRHNKGSKKTFSAEHPKMLTNTKSNVSNSYRKIENSCCRTAVESMKLALKDKNPGKDIGIQTETVTKHTYESGVIKYPTTCEILTVQTKQKSPIREPYLISQRPPTYGEGDSSKRIEEQQTEKKKDYVKENAQVVKYIPSKRENFNNPVNAPPTYKKGVIPKYLRERKEELHKQAKSMDGDEKCPDGHVVLPENERKETLRMLKQSYTELITELNLMPVRSDTLKIRNRKIELENQLKKLDEGIKVFTRPKVYVKIGA